MDSKPIFHDFGPLQTLFDFAKVSASTFCIFHKTQKNAKNQHRTRHTTNSSKHDPPSCNSHNAVNRQQTQSTNGTRPKEGGGGVTPHGVFNNWQIPVWGDVEPFESIVRVINFTVFVSFGKVLKSITERCHKVAPGVLLFCRGVVVLPMGCTTSRPRNLPKYVKINPISIENHPEWVPRPSKICKNLIVWF